MLEHVMLSPDLLASRTGGPGIAQLSRALLDQQKETWELLRNGYRSLETVRTREFVFDDARILIQYNPGRIASSSAKVDDRSIKERKCFLCVRHLPPDQRGLAYGDGYVILCNPFPITPEHFTIPRLAHVPQRIEGTLDVLLDLARDMSPLYSVFYNGPRCGASAPDHMHFQAGTHGFMPIETEFPRMSELFGTVIISQEGYRAVAVSGPLRRFLALEGSRRDLIADGFARYLGVLREKTGEPDEPMVNVLGSYQDGEWRILVFPRTRHRPSFFFAEGNKRLLISPAAVDVGGVSVTPLEEDFKKITRDHIAQMFEEVTLGRDAFRQSVEDWAEG
jgi:hypothetical protein